ncbi:MAG: Holliday junction branch migration protein RuvA [Bacteroidales bacterium]|jgi:Holliday junction DNA helicase RuvA|nr:Holliday junction branch migration protein RuvA [Bacteroidales bacterium]
MYEYIKGLVAELNPAYAVVEVNGIGYFVNISLTSYSALRLEEQTQLFLHQVVREDAHLLFGFTTKIERELFRQLITVNGVGPNTARLILSSLTPQELTNAILSENLVRLKSVKGIGAKTAQRIILDLKDKINLSGEIDTAEIFADSNNTIKKDALLTLTTLGFSKTAVEKVLDKVLKEKPDASLETVIKLSLNYL